MLGHHLHDRLEKVDLQSQPIVQLVHQLPFSLSLVAGITHGPADHRIVFLLHIGVVILARGPGSAEADLFLLTKTNQVLVDELAAVVRSDPQPREGRALAQQLHRFQDPHLGLIAHRSDFRPACVHVRHIQGLTVIPPTLASLMAHQVHFQKTGAILLPVGETLDRNLVFEQRSRLGPTAPLETVLAPLGLQQPIDGGGADLDQPLSRAGIHFQLPMFF